MAAMDNKPLQYDEFLARVNQTIYTSATPTEDENWKNLRTTELLNYWSSRLD